MTIDDMDISEPMPNGLIGCIDWLSFTMSDNVLGAISYMGFSINDFLDMPRGANGYKKMMLLNGDNIRVLYEGNADMGTHVDVSGSAIHALVSAWKRKNMNTFIDDNVSNVLMDLLQDISANANFTRIDLAIDDKGCKYFSCDDIVRLIECQQIVSKFREYDNKVPRSIYDGSKLGQTVYFGSRKSEILLRVYDKRLEQFNKHKIELGHEWVRWELELKKDRANQAVCQLLDCRSLSRVCIGILSNYIRFIVRNNVNKSRCSMDPTWARFITDIEKMTLYIPSAPKDIDDTKNWIDTCVGASISAVIENDGGSLDFFLDNLPSWRSKRQRNRELTSRLYRSEEYDASNGS